MTEPAITELLTVVRGERQTQEHLHEELRRSPVWALRPRQKLARELRESRERERAAINGLHDAEARAELKYLSDRAPMDG